jgi:hypothetical protein
VQYRFFEQTRKPARRERYKTGNLPTHADKLLITSKARVDYLRESSRAHVDTLLRSPNWE